MRMIACVADCMHGWDRPRGDRPPPPPPPWVAARVAMMGQPDIEGVNDLARVLRLDARDIASGAQM